MINNFAPFSIARLPQIEFGCGTLQRLPEIIRQFGKTVLLVTGSRFLRTTPHWDKLNQGMQQHGIQYQQCSVDGEPSPQMIDSFVTEFSEQSFDVVLGIGGGSVLDAAKAVAGLLKCKQSVMDFLEGVGPELEYKGPAVPFIAVPTTAGTGSEATKNAVLSVQGKQGFKKSFRDNKLVAEIAVVDPDLLKTCSPALIASNGMDALTQLMESYVSLRSNVMTDALAISGLRAARDGLIPWYDDAENREARERMSYAALLSGITLAQTGLGSVHGLASPLGAFFPIPHGVVCGTLVAEATRVNIETMQRREPDNPALLKYARLAEILCAKRIRDKRQAWQSLHELLDAWTEAMQLPRLNKYGITVYDFDEIVKHSRGSSMKTNPVVLTDEELKQLLHARL
jgi:alcohol dehydrogenase class IV